MAKVLPFGDIAAPPEPDPEQNEEASTEYDALMGMSVDDILREGQKALFARLVSACRAGIASHQELAILRNILKDNGLTLGIAPERPGGGEKLPLPEEIDVPDYGPPDQ